MLTLLYFICMVIAIYCIITILLKLPSITSDRKLITASKSNKSQNTSLFETVITTISSAISDKLPISSHTLKNRQAILNAAGINLSAKVYTAKAVVTAFLSGCVVSMLSFFGGALFLFFGILMMFAVYNQEIKSAEKKIEKRRKNMEIELPRFVGTIAQELTHRKDVVSILSTYAKYANKELQKQLNLTLADMKTGNYEAALLRFDARINSPMLSDVVKGLVSVVHGSDMQVYFKMLAHDLKQIQYSKLRKAAQKVPITITVCSGVLLACCVAIVIGAFWYGAKNNIGNIFN